MGKLLLVDGNSIMNRAFYGTQDSFMKNAEGQFTGAVYGFLNIFYKFASEQQPTYMAVAFDLKAPTFRHKMYEDYKAGRKGMPPELASQMPIIKEILDKMGITRLELAGYEADDIIGTYATRAEEEGMECRILTGDRDSFQLITEKVHVILPSTRQGGTVAVLYTPREIQEKYGVTPGKMLDVKALMGDSSDNIPGVPGIGEKTALGLIQEYGTLDGLYENLDKITKPALHKKLEEFKDQAYMSRDLAEICRRVPLDISISEMGTEGSDPVALKALFTKLEFHSLIKKFGLEDAVPEDRLPEREQINIRNIDTEDQLAALPDFTQTEHLYISYTMEGRELREILLLPDTGREAWSVMLMGPMMALGFVGKMKSAFQSSSVKKLLYHSKPLILWLMSMDCGFEGLACDASLAAYVCDGGRKWNGLSDVYRFFTGTELPASLPEAEALRDMAAPIDSRLKTDGLEKLYREVELPLVTVLADLERIGFKVDPAVLQIEGGLMDQRIRELTDAIYEYAGCEFNINSPKQLGEILFDKLGLESKKKTKTGTKATNQEVLEELSDKHPIVPLITEYRQNTKLKSTYIDGLQAAIDPSDGRVHSSFNQTVTATGRLSSTEPNLQNIPVRHELGKLIRKAFQPACPENVLIDADYSQIELRVMAAMSGDRAMIDAFCQDKDIHTITAAQINHIPEEMVTPAMRSNAKAVNFGIIYGISEYGLARDTGISRYEAKRYIESYFARYPGIKAFLEDMVRAAKEQGYASTLMGRRRYLPELTSSKYLTRAFGERVAMNMPIQGTAADIIKAAMIKVYNRLKNEGYKARLILQVHDELLIDCPKEEADSVKQLLKESMETAFPLEVPLKVSVAAGATWYDAK